MANGEPSLDALLTELAELRASLATQQQAFAQQQAAIAALQDRIELAISSQPIATTQTPTLQSTVTEFSAPQREVSDEENDRSTSSHTSDTSTSTETPTGLTSRRGLLRGAAAATAAATVAGIALNSAQPAHAAPLTTGGNFILGQANDADATTSLANTPNTTPTYTLQVSTDVANLANAAIYTTTSGANGVYAVENNGGNGLAGIGLTSLGYGVYGGSDAGWGVVGVSGTGADIASYGTGMIYQVMQASAGAPSGTFSGGESIRDANGDLWLCVAAGSPGTWVKVAHAQPSYTGGAINFLPVPIRVIDTRAGQNPAAPLPTTKAPLMSGQTYTFQITGTAVGGISVPAGAAGIYANITVVFPSNGGNLVFYPADQTQPQSSTINYTQGVVVGNYSVMGLSAGGAVKVFVNGPGNTDVVVDIAGFIM